MSIAATLAEQDLPDGPSVGEHEDDSLGTTPNVGGSLHLPGSTSALSRPAVRFQTAGSCPALMRFFALGTPIAPSHTNPSFIRFFLRSS